MRLIPELGTIANTDAYENAVQLTDHQARFLAHTITSKICSAIPDPSKPDLEYQTLQHQGGELCKNCIFCYVRI